MIFQRAETVTVPVRLVDSDGAPVTGMTQANILGGQATLVAGDSTTTTVTITAGSNWHEISATKAPGLYTLDLGAVPGVDGSLQVYVVPSASAFAANISTHDVLNTKPDVDLAGNILGGKQTIVVGADAVLTAYDSIPAAVKSWKITGSLGTPDGDHPYTRTPNP